MKTEIRNVYLSEFQDMTVKERLVYTWYNKIMKLLYLPETLTWKPWLWSLWTLIELCYGLLLGVFGYFLVPAILVEETIKLKTQYMDLHKEDELYGCYIEDCRVLVKEGK